MKIIRKYFFIAFALILLTGCGLLPPDLTPPDPKPHSVKPVSMNLTVTFFEPMIWGAGERSPGVSKWIRFPAGVYVLEAEDGDDYYYFKAPAPLDLRILRGAHLVGNNLEGQPVDERRLDGGLFLGKSVWRTLPAGGYFSFSGTEKVWLTKMGGDFLAMEPKKWKRNY